MAAIPAKSCPTLDAADAALEAGQDRKLRPYLGMSALGAECARQLWYNFRWAQKPDFDAATLKRFADGHASEAVVIARLKAVDTLEVHEVGEDGEQFGFKDLGGHMSGHMDGVILGLLQAPKTWHVLEVKACGEKKLAELRRAIAKVGEKMALRVWNPVYYAQAVLYMHYAGLDRHYLVAASPGVRDWMAIRTDADPAEALALIAKADRIAFSETPPNRIGERTLLACQWCDYSGICHDGAFAERNCRTCLHVTPRRDGEWHCGKFDHNLSVDDQRAGCGEHRFIPAFVMAEQIDADTSGVTYRDKSGATWTDRGPE